MKPRKLIGRLIKTKTVSNEILFMDDPVPRYIFRGVKFTIFVETEKYELTEQELTGPVTITFMGSGVKQTETKGE